MDIYRWKTKEGQNAEYRFKDNVCIGFFLDDELLCDEYKGHEFNDDLEKGLELAGFKLVKNK